MDFILATFGSILCLTPPFFFFACDQGYRQTSSPEKYVYSFLYLLPVCRFVQFLVISVFIF